MFYVTKTRLWDRDYGGAATVVATFVAISTRVYWRLSVLKKKSLNFCARFWNVESDENTPVSTFLIRVWRVCQRRTQSGVEFEEFVAGKLSSFV